MYERVVGVIVRPFGIRGEMKTRLLTDDPDCLGPGQDVQVVGNDRSSCIARIKAARPHKGHILLMIEGIENIEDAERWRGAHVRTSVEAPAEVSKGTYYTRDLIGMEVRHANGQVIGCVQDVLKYPAQDLLVVGDALIPAVSEIVTDVSLEERRITVDPPEGLLPDTEAAVPPDPQNVRPLRRASRRRDPEARHEASGKPGKAPAHAL